jgi:hypothetical protein
LHEIPFQDPPVHSLHPPERLPGQILNYSQTHKLTQLKVFRKLAIPL